MWNLITGSLYKLVIDNNKHSYTPFHVITPHLREFREIIRHISNPQGKYSNNHSLLHCENWTMLDLSKTIF